MYQQPPESQTITHDDASIMLFSDEPPAPNSINFQLELEDGSPLNNDDLFCCLRDLLVLGFKKFYSDVNGKVDVSELEEKDFERLNKYFNAIGFRLNYQVNSGMDIGVILFAGIDDEKLPDKDHHLFKEHSHLRERFNGLNEQTMTVNCKGKKYIFYFTPYVTPIVPHGHCQ